MGNIIDMMIGRGSGRGTAHVEQYTVKQTKYAVNRAINGAKDDKETPGRQKPPFQNGLSRQFPGIKRQLEVHYKDVDQH